ncbi:MAG: hypothetical protein H7281_17975 [Bacteriovorax sp.]|nr:hypothetical protein [Bacteriovorax sp.]
MILNLNNKLTKILSSLFLLTSLSTFACDLHGQSGFLPDNNLKIPVGLKSLGGINEVQFNRVMDKMIKLYSPIVSQHGANFVIERRWTDGTVNAFAHQNTPGAYTIVMFGGLARHQEITEDAMALVACHELGHHLGGAPKKTEANGVIWAANEGQADYWGTMKCLRHYFDGDDNQKALQGLNIPQTVSTKCTALYTNYNEQLICQRTSMAGLAVGKLFNNVSNDITPVDFNTPDRSVVTKTFDQHPAAQCRLDTYFQASLCDHPLSDSVSNNDPNIGVCSLKNGDKVGNRPLCWYKPTL